ncbi:MAG TPA: hypothetical protein PKW75_09385 [candidate division Zixibacteria bacterium]|nr:hypothetical protein [candidate division Zixibacteria bacterium]
MYDLRRDPYEMTNRINDPAAAKVLRQMRRELDRQSRQAGPDAMPVYEGIVNVLPKY